MKGFEFSLKRVLEVREIEEDRAQNQLFQAREKLNKTKEELSNLQHLQEELYGFLRDNDGITLEDLRTTSNYIQKNRQRIQRTENKISEQKQEVEKKKKNFLDKRKERRVLEKLKEKQLKEFQKEFLLKEQKILDEIGQRASGLGGAR